MFATFRVIFSPKKGNNFFTSAAASLRDFGNLTALRRYVHTEHSEFKGNNADGRPVTVFHHKVSTDKDDNDPQKVFKFIWDIITSHPNALLFATQKSRLLQRSSEDPNRYLPIPNSDVANIGLMLERTKSRLIRPDGGHVCMAITDQNGAILDKTQVSLRPGKDLIVRGRAVLHRELYSDKPDAPGKPVPLIGAVRSASHTTMQQEVFELAAKMIRDKTITAELTIIPMAHVQLKSLLENIKSANALTLYNLCSLVVQQEDLDKITDKTIKKYVQELKERAAEFPELQEAIISGSEVVLNALACTHAIAKACYGDAYAIDKKVGPDQDTQTAVVFCTVELIGTMRFMDFARKINFQDEVSNLTKPNFNN